MIQNSRKPIVITGAQKPISTDGTDARLNLETVFSMHVMIILKCCSGI